MAAKVLIVDDYLPNLSFIQDAMGHEGYETKSIAQSTEAINTVHSWKPDIVLLDVNMPHKSGLEILKELREIKFDSHLSIILVTSNSEIKQIVSGLDMGADDYLVKPFRIEELKARVRANLRVKRLNDDLIVANKRLKELADTDHLTSLMNMRYTLEKIEEEVVSAIDKHYPLSCIMFDMDDFKSVNDGFGHLIGSRLLVEIAEIVREEISETDIPARFGGDEFLIFCPNASLRRAKDLAETIRKKIKDKKFNFDGVVLNVTASFGVSGLQTKKYHELEGKKLIKAADDGLYASKNEGKDKVSVTPIS